MRRVVGLAELGRMLAEAPGELAALNQVAGALVGLFDASAAAVVLVDAATERPMLMARRLAAEALEGVSPLDDSFGSMGIPAGLGQRVIEAALKADEVTPVEGSAPDASGEPGAGQHLAVALRERDRRMGFVVLDRPPGAPAFDAADRALLAVAATQLAVFLRHVG
jgi:GAF domain-containing protein